VLALGGHRAQCLRGVLHAGVVGLGAHSLQLGVAGLRLGVGAQEVLAAQLSWGTNTCVTSPSYLSGFSSTYAIFLEGHDHVIFQQCSQLLGKLHLGHRLQGGFRHTGKKGGRHSLHSHSTGAGAHPPVGSPQKDGRLLRHGSPNDAQRNQRFPQHRAGFAYFGGGLMETKENEKCISKEPRRTQEALKTNRKVN